jgi:hypothetical protein
MASPMLQSLTRSSSRAVLSPTSSSNEGNAGLQPPGTSSHLRSSSTPNVTLPAIEDFLDAENRAWGDGAERPRSVPTNDSSFSRWKPNWPTSLHRSRPGTSSTKSRSEKTSDTPRVRTPRHSNDLTQEKPDQTWTQAAMLKGTGTEFDSELQTALGISLETTEDEEALRFAREREYAIEISKLETGGTGEAPTAGTIPPIYAYDVPGVSHDRDAWSDLTPVSAPGPSHVANIPNFQDISALSEDEQIQILLERSKVEQ